MKGKENQLASFSWTSSSLVIELEFLHLIQSFWHKPIFLSLHLPKLTFSLLTLVLQQAFVVAADFDGAVDLVEAADLEPVSAVGSLILIPPGLFSFLGISATSFSKATCFPLALAFFTGSGSTACSCSSILLQQMIIFSFIFFSSLESSFFGFLGEVGGNINFNWVLFVVSPVEFITEVISEVDSHLVLGKRFSLGNFHHPEDLLAKIL